MDLKEKWIQLTRFTQGNCKNFRNMESKEKLQKAGDFIRDTNSLRRLIDEIEIEVESHRESVQDLQERYLTTKAYRKQGEEYYCHRRLGKALLAFNNAIVESPLALMKRSSIPHWNKPEKCRSPPTDSSSNGGSLSTGLRVSDVEGTCRCTCTLTGTDSSSQHGQGVGNGDLLKTYRQCLAECFALRGQLLLEKNQYKEAEYDLDLCLSVHTCRPLHCSLYFLLGEALRYQGKDDTAAEAYNKCIDILPKIGNNCICPLELPCKDDVIEALASIGQSKLVRNSPFHTVDLLPELARGENSALAYGSSLIEVNYRDEKGRFLQASEDIKAGDTLIVEPPYASVLFPEYYGTHCYHCLNPVAVPYPCLRCRKVRFCSPECSHAAWSHYHKKECRLWPIFEMVDALTHLSVRSLLVAKREELKDVLNIKTTSSGDSQRIPGLDSAGFYQNNYHAVHSLVTNTEMQPEQALFSFSLTASVVACFLSRALGCKEAGTQLMETRCRSIRNSIRKSRSAEDCVVGDGQKEIVNVNSIAAAFSRSGMAKDHANIHRLARSFDDNSISRDSVNGTRQKENRRLSEECHSQATSSLFDDMEEIDNTLFAESSLSEMELGVLLLHHLQQMSCNVFAVTQLVTLEEENSESPNRNSCSARKELRRIAVALYPTSCLLNHSCDPDVIVSFTGHTMVVKATHNIQPGEEITHCYGPHVSHMIRAARQKMLRNQYYFTCRCGACRRDEELEREQLCHLALLCPVCRGASKVTYKSDQFIGTCGNLLCGNVCSVDKEIQQFRETKDELSEALAIGRQGDLRKSLSLLQAVLRKRSSILLARDKFMGEVHDALARCFAALGDWALGSYHCSLNIEAVEEQYGPKSPELGHELHRLSQFLFRGKYTKKALHVVERSIELLSHHYGSDYPEVKNLLKIRQCLDNFNAPLSQFVI